MTSYLISLGLLSSRVLIVRSPLLSSLRFIISSLGFFVVRPISHLHTILLEHCAFLYALVTDASISFPHLFIRCLIKVHRNSSTAHALLFPVFIHRILLHLSLVEFPASEPIHIVVPIGATFLR